jgi:nitroreductase
MLRIILKKYFPGLYNLLRAYSAMNILKKAYLYDIKRYFDYSDYFYNDSEEKCMMRIIHRYHPIEKGLCMPEMRLGFGKENISKLIEDCLIYKSKYLKKASINKSAGYQQFKHAISTLLEYQQTHIDGGYILDNGLQEVITNLAKELTIEEICKQIETTKEKYFEDINLSFKKLSESRHSLRNFSGKVRNEDILKAVEIAQNSPSACNRQPTRLHIVEGELKNKILEIQDGNRGFGSLADKVIIISVELVGYRDFSERNNLFVDGGLYAMSLLYALHSYKIGTCALNWCSTIEQDILLRKTIEIPKSQTVIMMIACGGVPDSFKLTYSKKNSVNTVVFEHK